MHFKAQLGRAKDSSIPIQYVINPEAVYFLPQWLKTTLQTMEKTGVCQYGTNDLLGASVPGVSGLVAGEHQLSTNSLGDGGSQASGNDGAGASTLFDPSGLMLEDDFTFETLEVINQYLKIHFCTSLDKDVRKKMHMEYLVPLTPSLA